MSTASCSHKIRRYIREFKKVEASTQEIEMMLSVQLKANINKTKRNVMDLGASAVSGLEPKESGGFIANICEPEDYKGRYYICKEPCYFIGLNKSDPIDWKMVFSRKICDKYGKAGICRRALIKVEYLV